MNRETRQKIAQETLAALAHGTYRAADGSEVALRTWQHAAEQGSRLYEPAEVPELLRTLTQPAGAPAEIRVYQATTLEAGARLVLDYQRVGCLNFASARHPGGGFLGGSQAQEESLARSSGLYPCLTRFPEMYRFNARPESTALYSDYAIYSPGVPVFRTDAGGWLPEPFCLDIITSPAVNAGALRQNSPELLAQLVPTMQRRIRQVLALAAQHGCDALILGAWGCGVFGNEPRQLAGLFAEALAEPAVRGRFRRVDFAIFDPKPPHHTLTAFADGLAELT